MEKIINKLVYYGVITISEKEEYIYSLKSLCVFMVSMFLCLIISVIDGNIKSDFIFVLSFCIIRRYIGGYHAKTFTRCVVISSLMLTLCFKIINGSVVFLFIIIPIAGNLFVIFYLICQMIREKRKKYINYLIAALLILFDTLICINVMEKTIIAVWMAVICSVFLYALNFIMQLKNDRKKIGQKKDCISCIEYERIK